MHTEGVPPDSKTLELALGISYEKVLMDIFERIRIKSSGNIAEILWTFVADYYELLSFYGQKQDLNLVDLIYKKMKNRGMISKDIF